jgi:hypothetical protein
LKEREEGIEVSERRGRRYKQRLDYFKETERILEIEKGNTRSHSAEQGSAAF